MAQANFMNTIKVETPNYSGFDLSYDHKLSLKMGQLVPVHVMECLPGDRIHMSTEAMFRMMPMIAPIMHKVDITVHHFYVPNRILWDNWEKFITAGEDGLETPALPYLGTNGVAWTVQPSELADYMGLPVGVDLDSATSGGINALPFAAYQRIFHEYYRDENLQPGDPIELVDGDNGANFADLTAIRTRAWEHDYFTACLPFAQKGQPVSLPLEFSNVDVLTKDPWNDFPPGQNIQLIRDNLTGAVVPNATLQTQTGGDPVPGALIDPALLPYPQNVFLDPNGSYYVPGDEFNTATTINDLRSAMALQEWLEMNARGGSRYVENLLIHFGIRSSDARLQRPEYLGGSKCSMSISEVLQTSSTDGTSPQGTMAGHGISVTGGKDFTYRCEEWGWIISILSIRPKTAYMQGIPKHFSKFDRYDYYWHKFAFLGEEPVRNKELYYDPAKTLSENNDTFGYLPRYSDYRYLPSRVSGQMRDTLDFWHMARKFANAPALNEEFIQCNPDNRIFAVDMAEEDTIVAHVYHKIEAVRPLPKYGTPAGFGHVPNE